MDDFVKNPTLTGSFEDQPDDALRAVIDQARSILEARKATRNKQAVAEIRRIAKEHGLDVAFQKPTLKRGRPRKGAPGST